MNQYKEKCLISLVTRDIQIRTTMRYNFTPVRMAITKNAKKKKMLVKDAEKGELIHF
jgi:hypothetical protein